MVDVAAQKRIQQILHQADTLQRELAAIADRSERIREELDQLMAELSVLQAGSADSPVTDALRLAYRWERPRSAS